MRDRSLWFVRFAQSVSQFTGQPVTFFIALATIVVWAISGPLFGFSDTWQLVINTGTTIVTFLMVFVIQNTQNRDTTASWTTRPCRNCDWTTRSLHARRSRARARLSGPRWCRSARLARRHAKAERER